MQVLERNHFADLQFKRARFEDTCLPPITTDRLRRQIYVYITAITPRKSVKLPRVSPYKKYVKLNFYHRNK